MDGTRYLDKQYKEKYRIKQNIGSSFFFSEKKRRRIRKNQISAGNRCSTTFVKYQNFLPPIFSPFF